VQIAMITHDAGQGRRVIAGWARDRLVLFDGLPGVLLALYDAGALTEREIRAEPWGVCAWRRFTGME
jgi:hypothetical protein